MLHDNLSTSWANSKLVHSVALFQTSKTSFSPHFQEQEHNTCTQRNNPHFCHTPQTSLSLSLSLSLCNTQILGHYSMAVLNRLLLGVRARATTTTSYSKFRTFSSPCSIVNPEADLKASPPSSSSSLLGSKPLPLLQDHHHHRHPVQWVFLGCPGVGKGTYASRLTKLLRVPHIATGDLVRDELSSSGPLSSQVQFQLF